MNGSYLPARILQIIGIFLLVGFSIFWALTGEQSTLFVGAAMSLILVGSYKRGLDMLLATTKRETEKLESAAPAQPAKVESGGGA